MGSEQRVDDCSSSSPTSSAMARMQAPITFPSRLRSVCAQLLLRGSGATGGALLFGACGHGLGGLCGGLMAVPRKSSFPNIMTLYFDCHSGPLMVLKLAWITSLSVY